ncbi:MAG TPA: MBL fold metallo-hydrolase [Longimicrobiales bacterium]|nr:MBL fold metallo-hydrolase [Longimicrobiales bacterium]
MKVTFWGTRGSLAKPGPGTVRYGGNTSCVQVETAAGTLVVLDCGTGAHGLGQALLERQEPLRGHILISHTHWDHIQGLPFFAPLFVPGHRWDIYGPRGLGDSLKGTLAGQMQYDYFPVTLDALRADVRYHDLVEGELEIGEIRIRTRYLNHPALTLGFRLEVDGAAVAYICDHEPHARYLATHEAELAGEDLAHAEFLRDADLVIHDAQYTKGEYPAKVGWGHSTADYAIRVCRAVGVRRLALTHHDPLHDDDTIDAMLTALHAGQEADGAPSLEVFAAREGETIELVGRAAPSERGDLSGGVAAAPQAKRAALDGRHRVLVALPESPEAGVIAGALEAEGVEIVRCASGSDIAERWSAQPAQLVLLEGSATGLEACRATRALGGAAEDVPIVLIAAARRPSAAEAAGNGVGDCASEWLTSPFSEEYARSRIRAWLLRVESRWVPAATPADEEERLAALRRLELLDSEPEERFDRLARLAAGLLEAPVSLVTLVDRDRQWFKSKVGTLLAETSRDVSFCAHAILDREEMVVPDALQDERFADNPIVAGPPHVRFYAGCPLTMPDGHAMGTLCVLDTRPRHLTAEQRRLLRDLADLVEEELARP